MTLLLLRICNARITCFEILHGSSFVCSCDTNDELELITDNYWLFDRLGPPVIVRLWRLCGVMLCLRARAWIQKERTSRRFNALRNKSFFSYGPIFSVRNGRLYFVNHVDIQRKILVKCLFRKIST